MQKFFKHENAIAEVTPDVMKKIQDSVTKGMDGIDSGIRQLSDAIGQLQKGYDGLGKGIAGMNSAVSAQKKALSQLESVSALFAGMGNPQLPPNMTIADMIPAACEKNLPSISE